METPSKPSDPNARAVWLRRRWFVAALTTASVFGWAVAYRLAHAGSTNWGWVALASFVVAVATGFAERVFPPSEQEREDERLHPVGRWFFMWGFFGAGALTFVGIALWGPNPDLGAIGGLEGFALLFAGVLHQRNHKPTPAEIRQKEAREKRAEELNWLWAILAGVFSLAIAIWGPADWKEPAGPWVRLGLLILGPPLIAGGVIVILRKSFPEWDWRSIRIEGFTLGFLLGTLYLLWDGSLVLAGVCGIVLIYRLAYAASRHAREWAPLELLFYDGYVSFGVSIERALASPPAERLFERLQLRDQRTETFEHWQERLLAEFKGRNNGEAAVWAHYRIQGKNLWKNGNLTLEPDIYDEWLLPEGAMRPVYSSTGELDGVRLRVCIINGSLKLQLGKFDGQNSPEPGYEWREWQTITSFPLFMWAAEHRLPISWMHFNSGLDQQGFGTDASRREFKRDLVRYAVLCRDDDSQTKRYGHCHLLFQRRRRAILADDGFGNGNDDWTLRTWHHGNGLLEVGFGRVDGEWQMERLKEFSTFRG